MLDPWGVTGLPDELLSSFDPLAQLREDPGQSDRQRRSGRGRADRRQRERPALDGRGARSAARARSLAGARSRSIGRDARPICPRIIARLAAEASRRRTADRCCVLLASLRQPRKETARDEALSVIRNQAKVMLGANKKEMASILSTARTQLAFLGSPRRWSRNLRLSLLRLSAAQARDRRRSISVCPPRAWERMEDGCG